MSLLLHRGPITQHERCLNSPLQSPYFKSEYVTTVRRGCPIPEASPNAAVKCDPVYPLQSSLTILQSTPVVSLMVRSHGPSNLVKMGGDSTWPCHIYQVFSSMCSSDSSHGLDVWIIMGWSRNMLWLLVHCLAVVSHTLQWNVVDSRAGYHLRNYDSSILNQYQ